MPRWFFLLIGVSFLRSVHAEEELNNGEDFTRPLSRFDLRYRLEEKADDVDQSTFILRLDRPIPLSKEWKIATRFEQPFVLNDQSSADNPAGAMRFGTGDFLAQAALIDTATKRFAWGFGARIVFPTASEDQFGSGRYQLVPLAGLRYSLPELSRGSFFQPLARYDFDVGGGLQPQTRQSVSV